jgi:uncharacterized protein YeaO (DUF488 family)
MTRGRTAAKNGDTLAHSLRIKRVYEPAEESDGFRVLVDRLWPRGVAKAKAHIDLWLKDIAPSDELRRRVHADPTEWNKFVSDYGRELKQEPARAAIATLQQRIGREPVTLLYAARDEVHNNAVALKHWLDKIK